MPDLIQLSLISIAVLITQNQCINSEPASSPQQLMCIHPIYPCYYFFCNRNTNSDGLKTFRCAKGLVFSERLQRCVWTLPWKNCEAMKDEKALGLISSHIDRPSVTSKKGNNFTQKLTTVNGIKTRAVANKLRLVSTTILTTKTKTTTTATINQNKIITKVSTNQPRVIKSINPIYDPEYVFSAKKGTARKKFEAPEDLFKILSSSQLRIEYLKSVYGGNKAEKSEGERDINQETSSRNAEEETSDETEKVAYSDDFNVTQDNNTPYQMEPIGEQQEEEDDDSDKVKEEQIAYIIVPIKLPGAKKVSDFMFKKKISVKKGKLDKKKLDAAAAVAAKNRTKSLEGNSCDYKLMFLF